LNDATAEAAQGINQTSPTTPATGTATAIKHSQQKQPADTSPNTSAHPPSLKRKREESTTRHASATKISSRESLDEEEEQADEEEKSSRRKRIDTRKNITGTHRTNDSTSEPPSSS
jgi:hypothetical protein